MTPMLRVSSARKRQAVPQEMSVAEPASPSAAGAAAATPGAAGTTPGADGTTPGAAEATPGAAARRPAPATAPAAGAAAAPAASGAGATIVPLYTLPHRSVVEHRHRREGGAPDGGRDRGREPGQRPWRRCRSRLRQRHRPAHRRRHQGHRLRGHRLRGEQPRRGEGGHRSLAGVLSRSDQRHLLRRAVEPGRRRSLLSRPVATREGAGAVVHGRQSRDGQRPGVRRCAGHDADLRERGAARAVSQLGGWHANHAPSNFGVIPYAASFDAAFVRNARQYVQYIYLQNDTLPNPWDSVPAYFADLLAALE